MKIVLAISDAKKRTILYVTDDGNVHSPVEATRLIKSGLVDDVYVATRAGAPYLRAKRGAGKYRIDAVTTSARRIFLANDRDDTHGMDIVGLGLFLETYQGGLRRSADAGESLIVLDGVPVATERHVRNVLTSLAPHIFEAARRVSVDPYLLGGIIVDESARLAPFETITENLLPLFITKNVSIGPAQVKLDTAQDLIWRKYFDPNPTDDAIHVSSISLTSRQHLFPYVLDPANNLSFAAAHMRHVIDEWKMRAGVLIEPDIIATLYSRGVGTPHADPRPSERGMQIVRDFLPIARKVLGGI
jgi:hypothetical protein